MGNNRKWTTDFNLRKAALERLTKPLRSAKARREAIERAMTMPNRLPPLARSLGRKEETR